MDNYEFKIKPNELLNIIKECSFDAFFITDKYGNTCFITDAYKRITGFNPDRLLNKNVSVLKEYGILDVSCAEKVLKSHQPTTMMLHYKNGKNVLVTAVPAFDDEGNIFAVVGNLRDMTELNNLKIRLEKVQYHSKLISEELAAIKLLEKPTDNFVCNSREMSKVVELAVKISKVNSTVLIEGESGVGKDVYAHLINDLSSNLNNETRPFVKISCGAIPKNLLESELFGYESGSFTGAKKEGKPGIFELAHNGTIFLDEIGEMPLSLQVKLLTVLQDREFFRVGGTKTIPMNARIIAATNVNLAEAVKNKTFREDLYFRLNVLNVRIPPLRERREDIVPLTIMAVNRLNKRYDMSKSIDNDVFEIFENYSWPGNVRELQNTIERLIVLSPKDLITSDQLPDQFRIDEEKLQFAQVIIKEDLTLAEFIAQMERLRILKVLDKHKPLKKAADELGIDLSTLTRKMAKYGLPKRYNLKYVHKDNINTKL